MLQIGDVILENDQYFIKHVASGIDELKLTVKQGSRDFMLLREESRIVEHTHGQRFRITARDRGKKSTTIVATLDLQEFKANILLAYTNGSATFADTITPVLPDGWTLDDDTGSSIMRTISFEAATPWDLIDACRDVYSVVYRFDNAARVIHATASTAGEYVGAFITEELNLKELNYKGKSTDIITRLYAVGADGLTFASVNDGKAYVDNFNYTTDIICGVWKDERYTVAANLLAAATSALATASRPEQSYECDVLDLCKTDPEKYGAQSFNVLNIVKLVDTDEDHAITARVVEYREYPHNPAKNVVVINSETPSILTQVKDISVSISNPNSVYNQRMSASVASSTAQILSGTGGYVVMNVNEDKRVYEILIMDTADIATAEKIWRWNVAGLGYSSTGYEGPYTTAITQDGAIVADFITAGTLNASLINVINLVAEQLHTADESDNTMDINTGMLKLFDGTNWRAAISGIYGSVTGSCVVLSGNTEYPEVGTPLVSALLDANARLSSLNGSSLYVGLDKDDVRQGSVYAKRFYAGAYSAGTGAYDGEVHAGGLYIESVAPAGEGLYEVSWKLVNLSGGGTAYALCRK